jgi:hypothetical protein
MKRGDRFVAYPDCPPRQRLFGEVTRVAKDGSWADIKVCTWAVTWTKRQVLPLPESEMREWGPEDISEQGSDWKLHHRGYVA